MDSKWDPSMDTEQFQNFVFMLVDHTSDSSFHSVTIFLFTTPDTTFDLRI